MATTALFSLSNYRAASSIAYFVCDWTENRVLQAASPVSRYCIVLGAILNGADNL